MDDPIGELLETQEHFSPAKAAAVRDCLLAAGKYGLAGLPLAYKVKFGWCMLRYKICLLYTSQRGDRGKCPSQGRAVLRRRCTATEVKEKIFYGNAR